MESLCFVNDRIHTNLHGNHSQDSLKMMEDSERNEIRRNICGDLQTQKHSDGNYYCIFHLPDKNKNVEEFREASNKLRLEMHKKLEDIKNLPDDKKALEKAKIKYDFRYVRFPYDFGLGTQKVEVKADFLSTRQ